MVRLLVNVDVDDLERGLAFYRDAFGLTVGRRLGQDAVEMLGAGAAVYLLAKTEGSPPFAGATVARAFARHWTPVHLDFVVDDLDAAIGRAERAGASREGDVT